MTGDAGLTARARSLRTDLHDRRRKKVTGIVRSVFTLPDSRPAPVSTICGGASRTGIAHDYLPKPDNDPAPAHVDAGEFVMPTAAEINATRLEVERHKRRLLESAPVTHGEAAE